MWYNVRMASEFMSNLIRESEERAARLEASNENHQAKVERPEPGYSLAVCSDGHDPVKVLFPDECYQCGGSDPYGRPFCPICEFCCGC